LIRTVETSRPGATFDLFLPRSEGAIQRRPERRRAIPASGGRRIFLVEDNADLRESTQEILTKLGFSVRSAPDGQAALEMMGPDCDDFDLLLTDVVMPGLDGAQLAREVTGRNPRVRVLYVSGYTDNVILEHGVDEHTADFLPKPFSAGDLARAIERALTRA
jgi:CheY-like chemotaxis protein